MGGMEAGGLIAGMLLFMAMPYVVVFGIGYGLLQAQRRARASAESNGEGD